MTTKTLVEIWTDKKVPQAIIETLVGLGLEDYDALSSVTATELRTVFLIPAQPIPLILAGRKAYETQLATAAAPAAPKWDLSTLASTFDALAQYPTDADLLRQTRNLRASRYFLRGADGGFDAEATKAAFAWVEAKTGRRLSDTWPNSAGVPSKWLTWDDLYPAEKGRFHPLRPTEEISPASDLFALSDDAILALHEMALSGNLAAGDSDEDLADRVEKNRRSFQGATAEVARKRTAGNGEWAALLARFHGEVETRTDGPFVPPAETTPPPPALSASVRDGDYWRNLRLWGDGDGLNAPLSAYINGGIVRRLPAHVALRQFMIDTFDTATLKAFVVDFKAAVRSLAALRGAVNAATLLGALTYDELEGETLSVKILSLIQYTQRRGAADQALWLALGGIDDVSPRPLPPPSELVELVWPTGNSQGYFDLSETRDLVYLMGTDHENWGVKTPRETGKALVRWANQTGVLGNLVRTIGRQRPNLQPILEQGGWTRY